MKRIPCMTRRSSRPGRLLAEVTARGCLHLQKDGRGGEGSKGECCNAPVIIQARTEWHDSGSRSPFAVYDNDKWFLRRFIISHSPRVCVASLMAERVSDIPPTRHWTLLREIFSTSCSVLLPSYSFCARCTSRRRCRIIYGYPGRTAGGGSRACSERARE